MATASPSLQGRQAVEVLILRAVATVLAGGVALIHFLDIFDKFEETPYQGWMFVALIAGSLLAAGLLLHSGSRNAWGLAALCGLVPFFMYLVSRSIGLPGAPDDVGNWLEALGLASLMVEASLAGVAGYALVRTPSRA